MKILLLVCVLFLAFADISLLVLYDRADKNYAQAQAAFEDCRDNSVQRVLEAACRKSCEWWNKDDDGGRTFRSTYISPEGFPVCTCYLGDGVYMPVW